jgi:hypothetical protein
VVARWGWGWEEAQGSGGGGGERMVERDRQTDREGMEGWGSPWLLFMPFSYDDSINPSQDIGHCCLSPFSTSAAPLFEFMY